MSSISESNIRAQLETVIDPEIRRPITDLDMVESIEIDGSHVKVRILLTVAGCPMQNTIRTDVEKAIRNVEGVESVEVEMGAMDAEQRKALREKLNGGVPEREIVFNQPGNLTRIYAVTSGKGGVGKSSMTSNLAVAMAQLGMKVGVVDADIYGFSIPRMLGVEQEPTIIDNMIVPPVAHDVKVISIGMFVPDGQAVVWRGPMLHRALQQFLADVYWGDLDVLLLDLPPGTGDVAISIAQLLPNSELLVVTTPQIAAAEVAQRTGGLAAQTKQRVVGIIENMSYLIQPDGSHLDLFGSGGGEAMATRLSADLGYPVPLLANVPLDIDLRKGADAGIPAVITEGPAADEIKQLAKKLSKRARGLSGLNLGISPQ